jgi:hypothetical protein
MTKNKAEIVLAEIMYLFLILFFSYTAFNKLININSFRTNLIKTSLFSVDFAQYFSVFVISLEIVIIMILLFFKKIGLFILSITIAIFTLYISFLRFKGLYEVCGCGGILNGLHYKYHLTINILLLLGALFSLYIFNSDKDEK